MFYDFDVDAKISLQNCVERIEKRLEYNEDGCHIWPGEMSCGRPRLSIRANKSVKAFDIRRLMFQNTNPDYKLAKDKIWCSGNATCDKDRCVGPEHLEIVCEEDWDPVKIRRRLDEQSFRLKPSNNFSVGCLLWTGGIKHEYGVMGVSGGKRTVHQLALLLKDGLTEPPKDDNGKPLIVRHSCTNKNCFEESHLTWGTRLENNQDMIRDGTNGAGEKNPMASISEALAREIKLSKRPQDSPKYMSQTERAKKYGVSPNIVSKIDCGVTWTHIEGALPDQSITSKTTERKSRQIEQARIMAERGLTEEERAALVKTIQSRTECVSNVSKDPLIQTPCQLWQGALCHGYGCISFGYVSWQTHIIVCEHVMKSKVPEGMVVRHLCGNRACCAEDHLIAGTYSQNSIDAIKHGTLKCKISVASINEIRRLDVRDKQVMTDAATKYGVSKDWLKRIARGDGWKFVELPSDI